jgi:3-phenylpropionate/cinnamic acid dioxygenase small subunit
MMGTEETNDDEADRGLPALNRRGLVRSLTQGAMAGTILAGLAPAALAGVPSGKAAKPAMGVPSYEAVRNLLATYSYLLDSADYPNWGALFGEDGTLELNGAVWARGAAGIAKKMSDLMAVSPRPITDFTGDHLYRHVTTNIHIAVDEAAGTAEARAYFFVLHIDKGVPPTIKGGGRYHDSFARIGGDWRFTAKRMDFDWPDA